MLSREVRVGDRSHQGRRANLLPVMEPPLLLQHPGRQPSWTSKVLLDHEPSQGHTPSLPLHLWAPWPCPHTAAGELYASPSPTGPWLPPFPQAEPQAQV